MKPSKSIFLIEDDKDDQFFFAEALREIKNTILYGIANNGREALDKLANAAILPDFIFTDINMPVMDGIDCLKEIIKNPLTKNIPVIILSSSEPHSEIACKLGAKAFIKKPSDGKILRTQVEKMINLDFVENFQLANQTFPPPLQA